MHQAKLSIKKFESLPEKILMPMCKLKICIFPITGEFWFKAAQAMLNQKLQFLTLQICRRIQKICVRGCKIIRLNLACAILNSFRPPPLERGKKCVVIHETFTIIVCKAEGGIIPFIPPPMCTTI